MLENLRSKLVLYGLFSSLIPLVGMVIVFYYLIDEKEQERLLLTIFFVLLLSIVLTVCLMLIFANFIAKPIKQIVAAIQQYQETNHFSTIADPHYCEAQILSHELHKLVETLNTREKEILRTKKLQFAGHLSASVAHEIRNPLSTIRGSFQLLMEKPDDKQLFQRFSPLIISELDRINNILTEMLDLSKPVKLDYKCFSLNDLIDNCIRLQETEEHAKRIMYRRSLIDEDTVFSDRNKLYQVILNLVKNAKDAIEQEGVITFTTVLDQGYLLLVIQDTGIGISQEDIDKIWAPFYTTKETGTGLGLATCIKIMEELHGRIDVESTLGVGTKMIIKIPISKDVFFLKNR